MYQFDLTAFSVDVGRPVVHQSKPALVSSL